MKRHHFERDVYTPRDGGLPELEMFGWTSTTHAGDLSLGPHQHRDAYEICLIADGTVQWWVGHEIYQLTRDDIYITRPDETHGGIDDIMHPCTLYWMIVPRRTTDPLPGLSLKQTRSLMRALAKLSLRSFTASLQLRQAFVRLHEELRDKQAFSAVAARAVFHTLLVQLLRDHERCAAASEPANRPRSATMQQAMQWIADHLSEDVAVERFAETVNLSVSRFHERFAAEVGLTPGAYRTHLRIRRAKRMLADPSLTVTHIAHHLGFSTSQYFATVFKKIVGLSPQQYRRRTISPPVA